MPGLPVGSFTVRAVDPREEAFWGARQLAAAGGAAALGAEASEMANATGQALRVLFFAARTARRPPFALNIDAGLREALVRRHNLLA